MGGRPPRERPGLRHLGDSHHGIRAPRGRSPRERPGLGPLRDGHRGIRAPRGRSPWEWPGLGPLRDGHHGIRAPQGRSPREWPGLGPLRDGPCRGAAAVSSLSTSNALVLSFLSCFSRFLVFFIFHLNCLFSCARCSVETGSFTGWSESARVGSWGCSRGPMRAPGSRAPLAPTAPPHAGDDCADAGADAAAAAGRRR